MLGFPMKPHTARTMVPGLASFVLATLAQNLEAAASVEGRDACPEDRVAVDAELGRISRLLRGSRADLSGVFRGPSGALHPQF